MSCKEGGHRIAELLVLRLLHVAALRVGVAAAPGEHVVVRKGLQPRQLTDRAYAILRRVNEVPESAASHRRRRLVGVKETVGGPEDLVLTCESLPSPDPADSLEGGRS